MILGTGRVKCSGCGLEAPTEGPLSQCREIMMGAGGFGRCKLPLDHEGHHLEGSWEMVQ